MKVTNSDYFGGSLHTPVGFSSQRSAFNSTGVCFLTQIEIIFVHSYCALESHRKCEKCFVNKNDRKTFEVKWLKWYFFVFEKCLSQLIRKKCLILHDTICEIINEIPFKMQSAHRIHVVVHTPIGNFRYVPSVKRALKCVICGKRFNGSDFALYIIKETESGAVH